jgi:hypothetical protein
MHRLLFCWKLTQAWLLSEQRDALASSAEGCDSNREAYLDCQIRPKTIRGWAVIGAVGCAAGSGCSRAAAVAAVFGIGFNGVGYRRGCSAICSGGGGSGRNSSGSSDGSPEERLLLPLLRIGSERGSWRRMIAAAYAAAADAAAAASRPACLAQLQRSFNHLLAL